MTGETIRSSGTQKWLLNFGTCNPYRLLGREIKASEWRHLEGTFVPREQGPVAETIMQWTWPCHCDSHPELAIEGPSWHTFPDFKEWMIAKVTLKVSSQASPGPWYTCPSFLPSSHFAGQGLLNAEGRNRTHDS